jgi:hypothetical protein
LLPPSAAAARIDPHRTANAAPSLPVGTPHTVVNVSRTIAANRAASDQLTRQKQPPYET